MLLEVSEKGAVVDLDAIPRPDLDAIGITFEHWVRMYPGMGFIMTAGEADVAEVCRRFEAVGMTARDIGVVDDSRTLTIRRNGELASVFDLEKEGIMRIRAKGEGCR
jgi:selenophosphate synthetase-related protein